MFSYSVNQCMNRGGYLIFESFTMLDVKTGDVNGDGIQDIVYLTGDKTQYSFYENIKLIIQDGKTGFRTVVPLIPNYNTGYNPWLFLGDFNNNKVDDILISLPVGGSGGLTYYYVVSFFYNQAVFMYMPEQFIELNKKNLDFEVVYENYYKVNIVSKKLNQTFILDVSNRKETYKGIVYNEDGRLIKPLNGFVIDLPHIYPIKFNRNEAFRLMAQQDIAGMSHADKLGYLVSYWTYFGPRATWTLNPNLAEILI